MNMPARRHRTSPHKGTSCGAKGGDAGGRATDFVRKSMNIV